MAYTQHRGKRVSRDHAIMLRAYERKHGPIFINQGARTLAEQAAFYRAFLAGGNLAAFPTPAAPHIKFRRGHHALDVNAPEPAQALARFYRSHGVPVVFNVAGEPWHMDFPDRAALRRAAKKLKGPRVLKRGSRGAAVITLKKLLHDRGFKNFSGKGRRPTSNRFDPRFTTHTQSTVKRFQKSRGLPADGIVGPKTWRKLRG